MANLETMYTTEKLTRFERARIIGARALQIAMGSPVLIDLPAGLNDPTEIAVLEFKKRAVPMTVVRRVHGKPPVTINISEVDLEEILYRVPINALFARAVLPEFL